MTNTKMERFARALTDNLNLVLGDGYAVIAYDASKDVYVAVPTSRPEALIKFETQPAPACGAKDSLGLDQRVFAPHLIKVGFKVNTKAETFVDLTGAVIAKNITIGGVAFLSAAAEDQLNNTWSQAGTDAQDAISLAKIVNGANIGVTARVGTGGNTNRVYITAALGGEIGNLITVTSDDASMVVDNPTLEDGADHACTADMRAQILAEVAKLGTTFGVYEVASTSPAVTDLVATNLVSTVKLQPWGMSSSQ